jgi:hypothetical protein
MGDMGRASRPPKTPRARAAEVTPEQKRERVMAIASLMARSEWQRGVTKHELAEKWGVTAGTVDMYAGEASRLLEYTICDRDELERYCRFRLREISDQDRPDRVQALQTMLKNIGRLNEKLDVTVAQLPDDAVVEQAVKQALAHPRWRELIRAELTRYDEREAALLLTEGETVEE